MKLTKYKGQKNTKPSETRIQWLCENIKKKKHNHKNVDSLILLLNLILIERVLRRVLLILRARDLMEFHVILLGNLSSLVGSVMKELLVTFQSYLSVLVGIRINSGESRAKEVVPEGKERLREVVLDTEMLVVNIVINRVIREQPLEWIKPERVSTVIVHSLHSGECVQNHTFSL